MPIIAVVLLVLLRVVVGLHFFTQGAEHLGDRNWSSAGFFRASTGPLSGFYHGLLPDTSYGWDETMHTPLRNEPKKSKPGTAERDNENADVYADWQELALTQWQKTLVLVEQHYSYDENQSEQAKSIYNVYADRLKEYLKDNQESLEAYRHELYRLEQMREQEPAAEVPYGVERISYLRAKTAGERASHVNWFKKTSDEFQTELLVLRNSQQTEQGELADTRETIDTIDTLTTWIIIVVGACLTLGLFSRTAAFVGGMFLLSVVLSQPLAGVLRTPQGMMGGTYPQFLEMLVLFAFVAVPAGRWCGLDSFLCRCCRGSKEANTK